MANELKQRVELLIGGVQLQNRLRKGIGTLACIVSDKNSGKPLGLTNKHILRRRVGKSVIQPANKKRSDEYIIGEVFKKSRKYDCAVFSIDLELRNYDTNNSIFGIVGKIKEIVAPYPGMKVQKVGQFTGRTFGIVKKLLKHNKFIIVPNPEKPTEEISKGGDSGALWVTDEENIKAVGLHTGGEKGDSKDRAWAISIGPILTDLDITF